MPQNAIEKVVAAKEGAVKVWSTAKKNPTRTMKVLSCVSGLLLVVGGFSGFFNFNPLKAVISLYNMGFGILILVTELKSWPIISTFQKRVDIYFHLLSVPKGKGGFYFFIGFLAFCASLEHFDMSTICVLIVSIVGVLHLFSWGANEADDSKLPGENANCGLAAGSGTSSHLPDSVASFGMQVLKDNPDMVQAGLSFAAKHPEVAAKSASHAFSGVSPSAAQP